MLLEEVDAALDSLESVRKRLDPGEVDEDEFRERLRNLADEDLDGLVDVAVHWRRRCVALHERVNRAGKGFEERMKEELDLSPRQSEKLTDWVNSQREGDEAPKH